MHIRLPAVAVHLYLGKASLRHTNHLSTKAIYLELYALWQTFPPAFYTPTWPEAPCFILALRFLARHPLVAFGLPLLSPDRKYLSHQI